MSVVPAAPPGHVRLAGRGITRLHPARPHSGRARAAAVLAGCAVTVLAALVTAGTARAAAAAGQDVPGSQIAAALRTDPVYVDPSLSSAFPAAARKALLSAVSKAPAPVYILAVPLVSGGQWATDQQLADVTENALSRPGIYLTLSGEFAGSVDAWTWPSDPQGLDEPPYHASDAAQAADIEQKQGAPVLTA